MLSLYWAVNTVWGDYLSHSLGRLVDLNMESHSSALRYAGREEWLTTDLNMILASEEFPKESHDEPREVIDS